MRRKINPRDFMAKAVLAQAKGAIGSTELTKIEISLGAGRLIDPALIKAVLGDEAQTEGDAAPEVGDTVSFKRRGTSGRIVSIEGDSQGYKVRLAYGSADGEWVDWADVDVEHCNMGSDGSRHWLLKALPMRPRTPPPVRASQTGVFEPHVRRLVMSKALAAKGSGAISATDITKVEVALGSGRLIEPRILKAIQFNAETADAEALLGEFMKGAA